MAEHDTPINSAEIAGLWGIYINNTAARCVMTYFLEKVEDPEIREVIKLGFSQSEKQIQDVKKLFNEVQLPVPIGFTEEDVFPEAPRLFSDPFFLQYLNNMSILGMTAGSFALATAAHKDVLTIQIGVINQALELHLIVKELALEKGIFIRSPYIPFPDTVEFASKQSYLGTLFGKQRPLNVIEMTHIFNNIQTNFIGKSLMLGFAQVTQDPELKAYYLRGKNIAQKHITLFSTILENEDIPGPRFWDTIVTAETAAPFSDKLMLFHASAMSAAGIANYGAGMAASPRRDIGLKYSRILVEVSLYAEDGANLMIDNGWLEEPPQSPDREHLIKKK